MAFCTATSVRVSTDEVASSRISRAGAARKARIRENIRYGRLEATDEEVEEAARATSVDRFVRSLPHLPDVGAVQGDAPGVDLVEAHHQVDQGGLAGAGGTPEQEPESAPALMPERTEGRVQFEHVDFSYSPDEPLIEVNLVMRPESIS
jgi:ABC-type multidrug transport system fused ATPase/permease subunit